MIRIRTMIKYFFVSLSSILFCYVELNIIGQVYLSAYLQYWAILDGIMFIYMHFYMNIHEFLFIFFSGFLIIWYFILIRNSFFFILFKSFAKWFWLGLLGMIFNILLSFIDFVFWLIKYFSSPPDLLCLSSFIN